jgi:uncharacterized repeat protein (TIGR01451 family)
MKNLLIILVLLCFENMINAQGWQKTLKDTIYPIATTNTDDGGYLITGSVGRSPFYGILKVDEKGNTKWSKNLPDFTTAYTPMLNIIQTSDSAYILNGATRLFSNNNSDGDTIFMVKKIDKQGNILWSKQFPMENAILKPYKNDYFIIGRSRPLSANIILRLNANGDTISQKTLQFGAFYGFDVQNDGILAVGLLFMNQVFKLNFEGQLLSQKEELLDISNNDVSRLYRARDSSYYYGGNNTAFYKFSKNGNVLWSLKNTQFGPYKYVVAKDDGIIGVNTFFDPNFGINGTSYLQAEKLDKTGKSVWKKRFNTGNKISAPLIVSCPTGGYLLVAPAYNASFFPVPLLVKMDEDGTVYPITLEGKIYNDLNQNCQLNATDKPFKNNLIEATKTDGEKFYAFSDTLGQYTMNLDSGTYQIKTPLSNSRYWQFCTPSVSKTFTSTKKTDTLDFLMYPLINCPALEVNITIPILRRCFNNIYTLKYCNKGTVKAENAYITVTLDSLLEFITASKPITSQVGRTYRFNVGTIATDDCGSFDITARVRCGDSTRLGQTLCVEAKIFPDTVCTPLSWSGANMTVNGVCQTDSVLFQVKNTGTAASSSRNLVVIEDEVLFLKTPIQLPQNGVFSRKFPANGKTWRMAVEQEPNHPTSSSPTAFVEGCRATNSLPFSTGFAPRFPNDDKALSVDIDCQQIRGAFDPNDKQGFPTGYKTDHFVAQNQDIEYLIRFQNTGTDTAFTVVLRDTISEKLDVSSIEFGASSHAYVPEIYGKGIVKFTFNNIKLVDSFKNEAKSHGFVQYRIKQQLDLVKGTKIFNNAGIYFDFNEPVITNKTLHTVGGKELISAIIEKKQSADFPLKVSPNPFTETAIFETPLSISGDFELYDMLGKAVRKERFEGTSFEFHRKDLTAGIYVFKISSDGKPLSIGKLIVQ